MVCTYDVIVFENQELHESFHTTSTVEAECNFLHMCRRFVSPDLVPKDKVNFQSALSFIYYSNRDKPTIVMLIGTITLDMYAMIRSELDEFYE